MQRKLITLTYFTIILTLLGGCSAKKVISRANKTYEIGEYNKAASYYRKAVKKVKNNQQRAKIFYRQAECYRILNFNQFAANSYRLAITFKYPDSLVFLRYGQTLAGLGQKNQAKDAVNTYLKYDSTNAVAKNLLLSLDSADVWNKENSRYIVKRERAFDSRRSDFCPVYVGPDYDVVYFNSTREGGISMKNSDITGMRPADFYMTRKDSKDEWIKPELVEGSLNTEEDEGVASVSPDGKTLYFTVCRNEDGKAYGASIYSATRTGAQWGTPTIVTIFQDSTADTLVLAHPAINNDGSAIYFVSDLEGGYGGKDIWITKKIGQNWSTPENLGPDINTPGNEEFPYFRVNDELYFSSNGWPGLGGLDIYKAVETDSGWIRSRLPAPINSKADDFGITFEGEREKGLFTSNRNEYRGNDHIYSFELPELQFILEGQVTDERDGTPLSESRIKLVGNDGTNTIIRTKKDGTYSHELNKGAEFVFLVTCRGYLNEKGEASTIGLEQNKSFDYDFQLSSIKKPIRLNNIFFAFNSAELNQQSKLSLDTLVEVLNDNPNIAIELSAHTDMIGDEEFNMKLSQERASSVMNYLISKGVVADRLEAKGYGKSQPVVADKKLASEYDFIKEEDVLTPEFIMKLTPEQQDICNQINRRTEFKVISTNYKPGK
ncbi:OmpA family protein [Saccharicrinis sp. FJH54]|uniref:PorE family type IX secretion system protein n=1 Tax=Saccharicrinis sp. FJH54 TaxID=3344665 RepID=UPI0035D52348